MKWTKNKLANRYRLESGEWTIDAIQKGFSETASFYVVRRNGKTIDTCDTIREAKEAVELAIEWDVIKAKKGN